MPFSRSFLPRVLLPASSSVCLAQDATRSFSSRGAGRIQITDEKGGGKLTKRPKLCSGCGVEVVSHGGTSKFTTGEQAVADRSKTAAKKARYYDVFDASFQADGGFLCQRCKALQSNNIWKAYDALTDVSPEVFRDQLSRIISRRRFGLCIVVVDATDPEHSAMKKLRKTIGKTPCWLVINKVDLVPRMSRFDLSTLQKKIASITESLYTKTFVVSAVTNAGIVRLAEELLRNLQGKDVFVIGAANVGKSTLVKNLAGVISSSVYMKGKKGKKRRDAAGNVSVTGSNLPGTTLQAVRVPCFSSSGHAIWDTPGIINRKALQYSIFPSHLMEPLTHPSPIPIPTKTNGLAMNLRTGYSLLIEASWMDGDEEDAQDEESDIGVEPCVLGRVDLVDVEHGHDVFAQCYLHPSLRVRVVPTAEAPSRATIPAKHVQRIHNRIQKATQKSLIKKDDSYSLPLKAFVHPESPKGEVQPGSAEFSSRDERYHMDLSFASLGWIAFTNRARFSIKPHCVEGSIFSKRKSLYPTNIEQWYNENDKPEHEPDIIDDEVNRRLQQAARDGRHGKKSHYDEDEWY